MADTNREFIVRRTSCKDTEAAKRTQQMRCSLKTVKSHPVEKEMT